MKRTMKRGMATLMALILVLSLLPAMTLPAAAVDNYDVWISGVQVTSENASDVLGDGGTVTYTPASGGTPAILALNGATITSGLSTRDQLYAAISIGETLTLTLAGTNSVTDTRSDGAEEINPQLLGSAGVISCGGGGVVTIQEAEVGNGATLNVTCANFYNGIRPNGRTNITLESGAVTVSGHIAVNIPSVANGSLTVNGGTLTAIGTGSAGISRPSNAEASAVTINGGTVIAKGTTEFADGFSYAPDISGYDNVAVKAGADENAANEAGYVESPTEATYQSKYVWIGEGPLVEYDLWIGGERVTSANRTGTGWAYTPASATLTLSGTNTITGVTSDSHDSCSNVGIYATGALTIDLAAGADVVVNSFGDNDPAINVSGNLTINGSEDATLTATGSTGIMSSEGIITVNGGTVNAMTNNSNYGGGIYSCSGSISITDGIVTATGGTGSNGSGIQSYSGAVTITGGTVTASGGKAIGAGALTVGSAEAPAIIANGANASDIAVTAGNGAVTGNVLKSINTANPVVVSFPTLYPVWVEGVQVTSANLSGTGWAYTPAANGEDAILALNNATLTNGVATSDQRYAAIFTDTDLTLTLTGTNTVTGTANSMYGSGIANNDGTLTVRAAAAGATLGVNCAAAHGIWTSGQNASMTLESGAVSVTVGGYRGCFYGTLSITGGEITCTASDEDTNTFLFAPNTYGYTDVAVKAGADEEAANEAGFVENPVEATYTGNKYVWIGKGVTTYPVWLGGVKVTENNKSDVLGDGKVSYTPAVGTKGEQGTPPPFWRSTARLSPAASQRARRVMPLSIQRRI